MIWIRHQGWNKHKPNSSARRSLWMVNKLVPTPLKQCDRTDLGNHFVKISLVHHCSYFICQLYGLLLRLLLLSVGTELLQTCMRCYNYVLHTVSDLDLLWTSLSLSFLVRVEQGVLEHLKWWCTHTV